MKHMYVLLSLLSCVSYTSYGADKNDISAAGAISKAKPASSSSAIDQKHMAASTTAAAANSAVANAQSQQKSLLAHEQIAKMAIDLNNILKANKTNEQNDTGQLTPKTEAACNELMRTALAFLPNNPDHRMLLVPQNYDEVQDPECELRLTALEVLLNKDKRAREKDKKASVCSWYRVYDYMLKPEDVVQPVDVSKI